MLVTRMFLATAAAVSTPDAADVEGPVLTLEAALREAAQHQPQFRVARAAVQAAWARADELRAPLLPQLNVTGTYQLTTANFAPRPGIVPTNVGTGSTGPTFTLYNYFNFGATLSQYIWDFGLTTGRWKAAQAQAEAQQATESATRLQLLLQVRVNYYAAQAQRTLIKVAQENLGNQDRHLEQIQGFVRVGVRPEIDLAQARSDRANAVVQLVNAQNGYAVARAQLNQAIGGEGPARFSVQEERQPPIAGEDQDGESLFGEALTTRPELASLKRSVEASEKSLSASKAGYAPALGASVGFTAAGLDFLNLVPNFAVTGTLTWNLFNGLLTRSQIREAHANVDTANAQLDTERQQLRLEVEQARLQVRAAKIALVASQEALVNARERLRLAEGRYQAGVGNIIELSDAQLAQTQAGTQVVQSDYNLATARAQLGRALGRP